MKAIRIQEFGGIEVMKLEEIDRPTPAADEILVRVHAAGVNPVDVAIREGSVPAMRDFLTLPLTLGWDAAGIVEELGSSVTGFQQGDAVYGVPNFPGDGSYAEYVSAKASQFALKPKSLTYTDAAAVPLAALTAWTGLFGNGALQAGQRVLIQGASGNVGSFAVQFAKAKGAHVIAIASGNNVDYLKQIGADEVIDYTAQNVGEQVHNVDLVLEASSLRDNKERVKLVTCLKHGGVLVTVNTDFPFDDEVLQALAANGATGELAANQPRGEWLREIAELIDQHKVQVIVRKVYPLEQAADAHRETGVRGTRGKVVLQVSTDNQSHETY